MPEWIKTNGKQERTKNNTDLYYSRIELYMPFKTQIQETFIHRRNYQLIFTRPDRGQALPFEFYTQIFVVV